MVFCRERESDRQPLSLIIPHLYLGAEADVTQDCLSSRGISYVLSVSRCCPQPAFLPQSQYLRIPIDDSLRDELLPWIPDALQFIDGAMSLGCSVLVHCAAGISRSPALTVAYIMYHLGLDLDNAYRFVKERRPSISPNFNFLGQLQCFQGTLTKKNNNTNQNTQLILALQCTNEVIGNSSGFPVSTNQDTLIPVDMDNHFVSKGGSDEIKMHIDCENPGHVTDSLNQDYVYLDSMDRRECKTPVLTLNLKQDKQNSTDISLSDKIKTLTLNQKEIHSPPGVVIHTENSIQKSQTKPMQLQIPSGAASLTDKRKTLKLSLTPLATQSQVHQKRVLNTDSNSSSHPQGLTNRFKSVKKRETGTNNSTKGCNKKSQRNVLSLPSGRYQKGTCQTCGDKTQGSTSKTQRKGKGESHRPSISPRSWDNSSLNTDRESFCRSNSKKETWEPCNSTSHNQVAPDRQCASSGEAVEDLDVKQITLSPLNLTVNKFFDWGGRMLLGALLGPRIKVGQAALPYRC